MNVKRLTLNVFISSEGFEKPLDVVGEGSLELDIVLRHRVLECNPSGVQSLAGEISACGLDARICQVAPLAASVHWIADDGVADVSHVDPNLVGAAGHGFAGKQ